MKAQRVIIQASSRSWAGGRDLCMNKIDGHTIVSRTITRVFEHMPDAAVTVAAPAFDRGSDLDILKKEFLPGKLSVYYGHDASPLDRMIDVCQDLGDDDHIMRVDGLHMFFDAEAGMRMIKQAVDDNLDCCKFADDFPVQFTSDVYCVGALRHLAGLLDSGTEGAYRVHPKFYFFAQNETFRCAFLKGLPVYSDDYLLQCRNIAHSIYQSPRQEVNKNSMSAGDQLSFHYELALKFLNPDMKVLDIASGYGYGTIALAKHIKTVHGADIDPDIIEISRKQVPKDMNITYHLEDVTDMAFASNEFDAITSMETIEHVNHQAYLREMSRVLKPNGILVLSTPQNCMGTIPVNPTHVREYSLDEIINICREYFTIDSVIGIKAGRIIIPNDPKGTNTVLVCRKKS